MLEVVLSIILVGLAFAGIAIKILVKKDGQFAGTCSSNNPLLKNENGSCGICGARTNEQCKKPGEENSLKEKDMYRLN